MSKSETMAAPGTLQPFDKKSGDLNVIVETPRGSRNKYKFDEDLRLYLVKKVLPAGMSFPYDFGFIPGTRGEDDDPLDVLILMDVPAYPGCLVCCRPIGVIEAEQTDEHGETHRNDRVIAVFEKAHDYNDLKSVSDMNQNLLKELQEFFVNYNKVQGRKFKLLGCRGPAHARKLIDDSTE
jgi:inorganic pyrophosphatase